MVQLGDKVRDVVSGFQGIANARYTYLQGCERFQVQPPMDKEGKLPEAVVFDEPLLEVLERGVVKPGVSVVTGGPKDHTPVRR